MSVSPLRAGGGILGRFLGNTIAEGAAFAAGVAIGPVLGPPVQELRNEVNRRFPFVFPGADRLAAGVAQGQVDEKVARDWAKTHGIGDKAFSALIEVASGGPGVAAAFDLWRRGKITDAGFRRALKRQGLEQEWIDALVKVKSAVLDPADLARGIHRGLVPDPGLLEGELPGGEGNVPAYPVYKIDALAEAAAAGLDHDHLGVLVGLQGNPMATHEAAQALFRGVLTRDDYLRAVAEGNTRNEWADAILEESRQIPTARDYIENALRGYTTLEAAIAGAARHGMSAEDATLIYQNAGRPMNLHQITTGLARGGTFNPEPGEIADPYMASIVEGSVKPAYYDLALANRYTLPGTFAIRALMSSGDLTQAEGLQLLLESGWEPVLAGKVAAKWAKSRGTAAKEATAADLVTLYQGRKITRESLLDQLEGAGFAADQAELKAEVADAARVKSARDTAITGLHRRYVKGELDPAPARVALTALELPDWTVEKIVAIWTIERDA